MNKDLSCRWCLRGGNVEPVFGAFNHKEARHYYMHKSCVCHATKLGGFRAPENYLKLEALRDEQEKQEKDDD